MPLTVRTNGSAGSNIITASWFNDFRDLLTGAMQDQEVTIKNNLVLQGVSGPPTAAPSLALAAGTNLGIGLYVYAYSYIMADTAGGTTLSPTASITTTTGNRTVNLTGVTVGPLGTAKRNIYRSVVGGGGALKYVGSILDNVTTTFTDTVPDGSLTFTNTASPTFGGSLILRDWNGVTTYQVNNDGTIGTGGGAPQTIAGTSAGTATMYQDGRSATIKRLFIYLSGYKNGATSNGFNLPVPFTTGAQFLIGDVSDFRLKNGGQGGTSLSLPTATGFGTDTLQTSPNEFTWGDITGPFDWIEFGLGNSVAHNGTVTITGV